MKTLPKILFVLSIINFTSCKKEINQPVKEKESKHVHAQKSSYKEFIKSYKPERIQLNPDTVPEYIFCEMGHYTFFDGKTKREIEYENILSKAGVNPDLKVVDINCNDNQKEFIVESAGGGTLGNYHYMDIMRYHSTTQKISSIFSCEISSFHWEEDVEKLDFVNYVDLLYKTDHECSDTIKIYRGSFIDKAESYNLNIKPEKLIQQFYFDKQAGYFKKITSKSSFSK